MKKKLIIAGIVISLILIVVFIHSIFPKPDLQVYYWRTSQVAMGDVKVDITATGTLAADTTVQVGTQVTGILTKQYVDFNSVVKKGQLLALIDTTTLSLTILDSKAQWEKVIAQREEYKRELDRIKAELDKKVAAQADYDLALTNFQTSEATAKSMEAEYKRSLIDLGYATIRAPINGIVISRNYDVGITVIASFSTPTLFTIANDLTKMQVQADIDETDIGQVTKGQEVDFTVDAYPDDVFHGIVSQIRLNPVTVQNVVNYVVIVEAPNPKLRLMPGLTANINIKVKEHKDILKVPANALSFSPPESYFENSHLIPDFIKEKIRIRSQQATSKIIVEDTIGYIWIKHGNDIFPIPVKKGLTDGIFSEISGKVKQGDTIVTGINSLAAAQINPPPGVNNPFMPKPPGSNKK